jgi:hypothetical protein
MVKTEKPGKIDKIIKNPPFLKMTFIVKYIKEKKETL